MKKRILTVFLAMCLACSLTIPAEAAMDVLETEPIDVVGAQIDAMEEEIHQASLKVDAEYEKQVDTLMHNANDSIASVAGEPKVIQLERKIMEEKDAIEATILEKYGYKPCVDNSDDVVAPQSVATDLTYDQDEVSYNASTKVYRYTTNWHFANQDSKWDVYDYASVGMTDSKNYTIYKSFAKTFTNYGVESCYVDNLGNSTPAQSIYKDCISKQAESPSKGVIFNVKDGPIPNVCIPTASGRITVYVKANSGVIGTPTNKLIASYHHNYSTKLISFSAEVSTVGLNSTTGKLEVVYEKVNSQWQRASGGAFLKT